MKYADRRNAPCVVIQGSDEKPKGEVTIKDLIVGAEFAKLEKGREEYLQKQAQAQRAVPEANSSNRPRSARPARARAPLMRPELHVHVVHVHRTHRSVGGSDGEQGLPAVDRHRDAIVPAGMVTLLP